MADHDARIQELEFLTKLELAGGSMDYKPTRDRTEVQMVVHLLNRAYLNDVGSSMVPGDLRGSAINWIQDAEVQRISVIRALMNGQNAYVTISHAGRVRRAELAEALQSGRDRDPTGLAIAMKYRDRDLRVALLHASSETPVSVAFVDMNGLKAINDESGSHAAGDAAIRAYLQVIAAHLAPTWDAYRGEGGDEVVVIMRSAPLASATKAIRGILESVQRETAQIGSRRRALSASCGIASTSTPNINPADLLDRADKAQYRAKALSKKHDPRPSTLAIEEGEAVLVPMGA